MDEYFSISSFENSLFLFQVFTIEYTIYLLNIIFCCRLLKVHMCSILGSNL